MIDIIWTVTVVLAITAFFVVVFLLLLGGTETGKTIDHAIAERIKGREEDE